ncbi:MAG: MBL fold metallo-hydrolase [Pseudomonadota bacterium]
MTNSTIKVREIKDMSNESFFGIAVFNSLAGDCIYLMLPSGKNILFDTGFHKGDYIINAIKNMPGKLHEIVITHQHLDHFASLSRFVKEFKIPKERIHHSGVAYEKGYIPDEELSSCKEYEGQESVLWHQYYEYIDSDSRWELIETQNPDLSIRNLVPQKPRIDFNKVKYHELNDTSTPMYITWKNNKILIASDMTAYSIQNMFDQKCLSKIDLYVPSSHGNPKSNPVSMLNQLNPDYVCVTDAFVGKGSNFYEYYQEVLPHADTRSLNVDGSQFYHCTGNKVTRYTLLHDEMPHVT